MRISPEIDGTGWPSLQRPLDQLRTDVELAKKEAMPPAARVSDPTSHGAPTAPGPGSANVLIGGLPAWRAMIDQHACPAASASGADGLGSVMKGSATVLINSQMACRQGDIIVEKPGLAMGPANPIAMGCPTVLIGEMGPPVPPSAGGAALARAMAKAASAEAAASAQAEGLREAAAEATPLVAKCPYMDHA